MNREEVLLGTKIAVASILTSPPAGIVIAAATLNRVPNHGLRFDVSDRAFSPRTRAALFRRLYQQRLATLPDMVR